MGQGSSAETSSSQASIQASADQANRANQCNPNHTISGPGRSSAYQGSGTPADLINHSNQMNPDNWRYWSSRGQTKP